MFKNSELVYIRCVLVHELKSEVPFLDVAFIFLGFLLAVHYCVKIFLVPVIHLFVALF